MVSSIKRILCWICCLGPGLGFAQVEFSDQEEIAWFQEKALQLEGAGLMMEGLADSLTLIYFPEGKLGWTWSAGEEKPTCEEWLVMKQAFMLRYLEDCHEYEVRVWVSENIDSLFDAFSIAESGLSESEFLQMKEAFRHPGGLYQMIPNWRFSRYYESGEDGSVSIEELLRTIAILDSLELLPSGMNEHLRKSAYATPGPKSDNHFRWISRTVSQGMKEE